MAKSVDWLYHRKSCISCQRARAFLEKHDIQAKSSTDAVKDRQDGAAALTLARSAKKLIVARGQKVVHFDMQKDAPDDATLVKHIIGPTGNLRAPTVRKGTTLYIGFNEEAYTALAK